MTAANLPNLYFKQLEVGPMQNFVYLLGDKEKKECVVVDPAWEIRKIIGTAEQDGMKVIGALATHSHFDHVNGASELFAATRGKMAINAEEVTFSNDFADKSGGVFVKFPPEQVDLVKGETKIRIGGIEVRTLLTPGHTPGSQCFLAGKYLISGDTLFVGYCGRSDFAGGDPWKLFESLSKKLFLLDDDIVLYPGHNYSDRPFATMGDQKKTNPYLKARKYEEFTTVLSGL